MRERIKHLGKFRALGNSRVDHARNKKTPKLKFWHFSFLFGAAKTCEILSQTMEKKPGGKKQEEEEVPLQQRGR